MRCNASRQLVRFAWAVRAVIVMGGLVTWAVPSIGIQSLVSVRYWPV